MRHFVLLLLSSALVWQVTLASRVPHSCKSKCPWSLLPVCGDGKMYIGECMAKCAGARHITAGSCDPCACTPDYKPVCCDGKTYSNKCKANCECKKKNIKDGPCEKEPCVCTKEYKPVCCDGKTYGNKCMARCHCEKPITKGPCCPPCTVRCTDIYAPVCADGVTYRNRCKTQCLCPRPEKVVDGECPSMTVEWTEC